MGIDLVLMAFELWCRERFFERTFLHFLTGIAVMDMMPGRGGIRMASSAVAKYEQLE
jgi:hypothetical protein